MKAGDILPRSGAVIPQKMHSAGLLPCHLASGVAGNVVSLVLGHLQLLIPVLHGQHRRRRSLPDKDCLGGESGRWPERKAVRWYPTLETDTFSAVEASP